MARLKLGESCALLFTRLFVLLLCSSCPGPCLGLFPLLSLGLTGQLLLSEGGRASDIGGRFLNLNWMAIRSRVGYGGGDAIGSRMVGTVGSARARAAMVARVHLGNDLPNTGHHESGKLGFRTSGNIQL